MTDPANPESPESQRTTDEERDRRRDSRSPDGHPETEPPVTGSASESIEREH